MAFGQQSGPPASHRQVQTLLELLENAGHSDFRDARGPMGFTQRQAGGKFTVDEAQGFIDQLEQAQYEDGNPAPKAPKAPAKPAKAAKAPAAQRSTQRPAQNRSLSQFTTKQLATELQRRGWIVMEP